jgi:hypothetical protein
MMDKEQVHQIMMEMYPEWRYRWCGSWACACMGAANCSGGAASKGVTFEQWEEWKKDYPYTDEPIRFNIDTRTPLQKRLDAYKASK